MVNLQNEEVEVKGKFALFFSPDRGHDVFEIADTEDEIRALLEQQISIYRGRCCFTYRIMHNFESITGCSDYFVL